jgi:YHS domain-containing protein
MTRAILYLIAFVLIIGVARSVLGVIAKGFSDIFGAASSGGASPGPRSAPLPKAEALKKDPVCGTFIAPSTAVQKVVGGQTYYFCSPECRDKFRG